MREPQAGAGRVGWAGGVAASGVHRSEAGGRGTGLPPRRKEGEGEGPAGVHVREGEREGKGKKEKEKKMEKRNGGRKREGERDPRRDHDADRGAGRPRLAPGRVRARCAGRGKKNRDGTAGDLDVSSVPWGIRKSGGR